MTGALAQHAELTLQSIGLQREPLVREIFRNLVTAQGTRAVRDVEDLLSVFGKERSAAAEVLGKLVNARLLTTYDVTVSAGIETSGRPRIEIIHESLLSAWPRRSSRCCFCSRA